jgi:hypothetical protein
MSSQSHTALMENETLHTVYQNYHRVSVCVLCVVCVGTEHVARRCVCGKLFYA